MSYRQQVKDILSSHEPHRELVSDLAQALYNEYHRGLADGYEKGRINGIERQLDDDGPRYINHRLRFPDTLPIADLRINPTGQKYFVGQRVYDIIEDKSGFIVDKDGDNWVVLLDDSHRHTSSGKHIIPVKFYIGQPVLYADRMFTIKATGRDPVSLEIVRLILQDEMGDTIITVDIDYVTPLTKIDILGGELWIDATNLADLVEVHDDYRDRLTDLGKRQILSIARYLEAL
jgi:hypothetical protein